jgi:hypothetical protein
MIAHIFGEHSYKLASRCFRRNTQFSQPRTMTLRGQHSCLGFEGQRTRPSIHLPEKFAGGLSVLLQTLLPLLVCMPNKVPPQTRQMHAWARMRSWPKARAQRRGEVSFFLDARVVRSDALPRFDRKLNGCGVFSQRDQAPAAYVSPRFESSLAVRRGVIVCQWLWGTPSSSGIGARIRYQTTKVSAAAWRGFSTYFSLRRGSSVAMQAAVDSSSR